MDKCDESRLKFNNCNVSLLLGITIDHVEKGLARGTMPVKSRHINVFGGIHGGILFAFADQIGGACGNSLDYTALLVESTGRFKKSAREGEVVYAEARLVNSRKGVDTIEINVTNEAGEILANLTMKSYVIDNARKTP